MDVVKEKIVGARVVRGPDWEWYNQDNNGEGVITDRPSSEGWVYIEWKSGTQNQYRIGYKDRHDLYFVEQQELKFNFL